MLRESAKLLVRLGRLERPLNALSTHSLCRLGYRRFIHIVMAVLVTAIHVFATGQGEIRRGWPEQVRP